MKITTGKAALILLAFFSCFPFSTLAQISQKVELKLEDFEESLTDIQRLQFNDIPEKMKSFALARTEDNWVLPEFHSLNGELVAVPKVLASETNLITTLSLPVDAKTSTLQWNDEGVNLNSLFYNSESLILKEFSESYRSVNNKRSVGPGEIPIIDIKNFPASVYTKEAVLSQQNWAKDPCNLARTEFRKEIELRVKSMFPNLSSAGVLNNSWSEERKRKLAQISKSYDERCLISVIEADKQGLLPKPIKSRMAILTRNGMPFCGAFRVGKTKLITARHCFFQSSSGKAFDYTKRLLLEKNQSIIQVHLLNDILSQNATTQSREHAVSGLIFDGAELNDAQVPYGIGKDFIFIDIIESSEISELDKSAVFDDTSLAEIHEPLMLIGYFAFHNADWRFQIPGFELRPWREGLRLTRGNYCRIFDRSKNGKCLAHGCQSMVLFSGGPLISTSGFKPNDGGISKIRMLGVHTKSGDTRQSCGVFEVSKRKRVSAVGAQGGFAVSSSWIN